MSIICGLTGECLEPELSRHSLKSMLSGSRVYSSEHYESRVSEFGTLAICHRTYDVSISHQDNVQAALIGNPTWDNDELIEFATNFGMAASLSRAYELYGTDLLSHLHGPFALAVQSRKETLLAVDRFGIHRLSYAFYNDALVFSTSTDCVTHHPDVSSESDPQAIFNYFYFYQIPSPGTFFKSVQKLLPAQFLLLRNKHVTKNFYWQLSYNNSGYVPPSNDSFQQFRELLNQAVSTCANNSTVATFLSGGTDSSTVTGMLSSIQNNPVDAYSIGFGAEGFDEMMYARIAAKHFKAHLHEYYLKPEDILEAIPIISECFDEPFANESAVPTYFCAKRAAEDGFQTMLAGDGGDEIFGGNTRYSKQMVFEHYGKLPVFFRNYLIEPMAFNFPYGDSLLPIRKLQSYLRQAKNPLPERLESYNFVYRQGLEEMFEPDFLSCIDADAPKEMLREAFFRTNSDHPVSRMLHLDLKFTLADNDLRKVSRMCEAAGVEVRYPLLDEALAEFSATLPPHFMVKGNKTRWFFKRALNDFLPKEIITKSKHGFGLPFGVWALTHPELQEFIQLRLKAMEDRGYLRSTYIRSIRQQHVTTHPTYFGKMIWVIVMLEQWIQSH